MLLFLSRWPHRLARPRTPDSHSGDTGSNPVGATNKKGILSEQREDSVPF